MSKKIDNSIIEEKIKSEMNLTSFRNNTLYNTILKDNKAYPDNTDASPSVDSKDGIDFSKPSSLTNGIGLFYTGDTSYTNDNKTVYYDSKNPSNCMTKYSKSGNTILLFCLC